MNFCSRWSAAAMLLVTCLITNAASAADLVQLTDDGALKRDPRFINGGAEILYCYDENPDLVRMMKMRADERKPVPIFEDAGNKHQLEPACSPDGRYIVFTECTGNLTARLVIRTWGLSVWAYFFVSDSER